jgi:hypothetical protein
VKNATDEISQKVGVEGVERDASWGNGRPGWNLEQISALESVTGFGWATGLMLPRDCERRVLRRIW